MAFFAGCVARVTFTALNDATIRVLQANGCEVVVSAGPSLLRRARGIMRGCAMSRANWHEPIFARLAAMSVDAILTNAAGCGSTLKEYPHLFPVAGAPYARSRLFFATGA